MNKYDVQNITNSSDRHSIDADDFKIDAETIIFYNRGIYGIGEYIAAFPSKIYRVIKTKKNENT